MFASDVTGAIIIEGHVQGLSNTRALGAAGIPVLVVDTVNCVARYSRYCKGFYRCPAFDSDDLADFLMELARSHGLSGWLLLPSNDHAVLTLSRNRQRLGKHYKVITPGLEIIENIYDKSRLLAVAERAGVPIPATFYAGGREAEGCSLAFPVLTRGRFGLDFYRAVGRKAFLANDRGELREQLSRIEKKFPLNKTMTQELIPDDGTNKTVSFCAFCESGVIKAYWIGVKIRQHPIRFGTATFAQSVYIEDCHAQSVPLLQALNYTGVCEVEYLRDPRDGKYKLIEINPRTWLWVGLAKACGIDYAKMIYDYVNGAVIEWPKSYKADIYWINPLGDFIYSLSAIMKKKLSLPAYFSSIQDKDIVNALFARNDRKPGFIYLLKILSFLKQR